MYSLILALTNNDSFNAVNNSNKRQLKKQNRNKQTRNVFGIVLFSFRNNSTQRNCNDKMKFGADTKVETESIKTSAQM